MNLIKPALVFDHVVEIDEVFNVLGGISTRCTNICNVMLTKELFFIHGSMQIKIRVWQIALLEEIDEQIGVSLEEGKDSFNDDEVSKCLICNSLQDHPSSLSGKVCHCIPHVALKDCHIFVARKRRGCSSMVL